MRLISARSPWEQLRKIQGVTLDRVLVKQALAADNKLGIVFYYETDAGGTPILFGKNGKPWTVKYKQYDKDGKLIDDEEPSFRTRIAHGKVEFVMRDQSN